MSEQERIEGFWEAVDAAEDKYGVMLGVYIDDDGEPQPMALALEDCLEKSEIN